VCGGSNTPLDSTDQLPGTAIRVFILFWSFSCLALVYSNLLQPPVSLPVSPDPEGFWRLIPIALVGRRLPGTPALPSLPCKILIIPQMVHVRGPGAISEF
jgi:hypothetical protein